MICINYYDMYELLWYVWIIMMNSEAINASGEELLRWLEWKKPGGQKWDNELMDLH